MRSVLAVTAAAVLTLADPMAVMTLPAAMTVVAVASAAIVALTVRWYRHP